MGWIWRSCGVPSPAELSRKVPAGDAFTAGASALVILAFAELAGAATGICGPMIDMTGHTRVKLANSVLYATLAIAVGVALIPRWGVVGAAVAALIAMATVNIVCEVWFLERFTPFDWTFWKPISAGIGALATGWAMARWTNHLQGRRRLGLRSVPETR